MKRLVALIMVLTLCISSFAACKANDIADSKTDIPSGGDDCIPVPADTAVVSDGGLQDVFSEHPENADNSGLLAFSYDLFKQVAGAKNPVFSPLSAYIALSMVGIGSDGNTLKQFKDVFGEQYADVSSNCVSRYNFENESLRINTANSAWLNKGYNFQKSWLDLVADRFDSEVQQTDLTSRKAVSAMNSWVSDKTKGLIKEMVSEPFEDDTRLVLFNTLYFKGKWANSFLKYDTYEDEFTRDDGTKENIDMMHLSGEQYRYLNGDDYTGAVMWYMDGNYAMVALRPNEGTTARELLSEMNPEFVHNALKDNKTKMLNLKLPKFESNFDESLIESLENIGLTDVFDAELADLSLMEEKDRELFVSIVQQKARIKVEEEGTEAAAVTMVAVTECCAAITEETPVEMYFDKPFVYMIMDMDNEVPLFIGIFDGAQ